MVSNSSDSVKMEFSEDKCFEIIHLTIIDILSEKKDNILSLDNLIKNLNLRTKIYKLHNSKRLNMFSKYLKIEYGGVLKFLEMFNFYSVVKNDKTIYIKYYKNLVDLDDIKQGEELQKIAIGFSFKTKMKNNIL